METISRKKTLWGSVGVTDPTISKRESHSQNSPRRAQGGCGLIRTRSHDLMEEK